MDKKEITEEPKDIQTATGKGVGSSELLCDGACEIRGKQHKGEVRKVHILNSHFMKKEYTFNYCETAIEDDEKDGFKLKVVT